MSTLGGCGGFLLIIIFLIVSPSLLPREHTVEILRSPSIMGENFSRLSERLLALGDQSHLLQFWYPSSNIVVLGLLGTRSRLVAMQFWL